MRVVVPTDDGVSISRKMFGMSNYFYIYECVKGKLKFIERRKNTLASEMPRGKTYYVVEELNDCDVFVVGNIGKRGRDRVIERGKKIFDVGAGSVIKDVVDSMQQDMCGAG